MGDLNVHVSQKYCFNNGPTIGMKCVRQHLTGQDWLIDWLSFSATLRTLTVMYRGVQCRLVDENVPAKEHRPLTSKLGKPTHSVGRKAMLKPTATRGDRRWNFYHDALITKEQVLLVNSTVGNNHWVCYIDLYWQSRRCGHFLHVFFNFLDIGIWLEMNIPLEMNLYQHCLYYLIALTQGISNVWI
jgi:hypothetical protein